jgi:hypothetical protein
MLFQRCSGVWIMLDAVNRNDELRHASPQPLRSGESVAQCIVDYYLTEAKKQLRERGRVSCVKIPSRHYRKISPSIQPTWKAVGRAIRVWLLEHIYDRCDCRWCRTGGGKRGRRENYWIAIVGAARRGDTSALVEHLNSRRTLTRFDRRCLAEELDASFKGEWGRPRIGRPRKVAAHSCASVAVKFYKDWKEINLQCGIKDWGYSDEMKDEICRIAIEAHAARFATYPSNDAMSKVPSFEEVRELMDRPKARR